MGGHAHCLCCMGQRELHRGASAFAGIVQIALCALQDTQALTRAPETRSLLRTMLQHLFRNPDTVKLGFGLSGDLLAIKLALGPEGGGCIARVHSHIDLRALHSHLRHAGAPLASAGPGLAGVLLHGTPCHAIIETAGLRRPKRRHDVLSGLAHGHKAKYIQAQTALQAWLRRCWRRGWTRGSR